MITRLTLVCHAATAAQRAAAFPGDEPIEPRWRAEAASLGARIGPAAPILAGPETRCRETAAAMGRAAEAAAELRDCAYGAWTGRPIAEVEKAEPDALMAWLADPEAAPHGGESLGGLLRRTARWLDTLDQAGHILAVTHPAIIRAAILHVVGAPFAAFWRLDISPLSATDLRRAQDRWTIRAIGCRAGAGGADEPA